MQKHNKPFSEPNSLFLAFAKNLASFAVAGSTCIYTFDSFGKWLPVEISSPSLRPSCIDNGNGTYNINIVFRIPFASKLNSAYLSRFKKEKVIAKYKSASGNDVISGTKEYPLTFDFSKPEGYDGFECVLKGTQTTPESVI